ncbi:MAG: hypothetical protein VB138_15350 [Burkholderia sp.]
MANVIHKFLLRRAGQAVTINLPAGSLLMKIDVQDESPYAWVFLNKDASHDTPHDFLIVGTGREIPDGYWLFHTFFEGAYVWHGCLRIRPVGSIAHV